MTSEPNFPATPENTRYCHDRARRNTTHEKRSRPLATALGLTALYASLYVVSTLSADIQQGIHSGKERVASDTAQIHSVHDYVGSEQHLAAHATVVLTGLGTKDATETAATITAHQEVGSVYAIEYGNQDLDTTEIAALTTQQMQQDGIDYISFDGYSMGGPIALDIANKIEEHDSDLTIVSVILNSSPAGEHGLSQTSQQSLLALESVLSLHEDLVYYEKGQILMELIARNDRYINQTQCDQAVGVDVHSLTEFSFNGRRYAFDREDFMHELTQIQQKISGPKTADANLIYNQARVLKLNITEKIEKLNEDTMVVYTRSRNAEDDGVVNVEASAHTVKIASQAHARSYKIIREHIRHANPVEQQDEYNSMIRHHIQPSITHHLAGQATTTQKATPNQ